MSHYDNFTFCFVIKHDTSLKTTFTFSGLTSPEDVKKHCKKKMKHHNNKVIWQNALFSRPLVKNNRTVL